MYYVLPLSLLHEVPEGKGHGAKKIETFKKGIF